MTEIFCEFSEDSLDPCKYNKEGKCTADKIKVVSKEVAYGIFDSVDCPVCETHVVMRY